MNLMRYDPSPSQNVSDGCALNDDGKTLPLSACTPLFHLVDLVIPVRVPVARLDAPTLEEALTTALEILRVQPVRISVGGVPLMVGQASLPHQS